MISTERRYYLCSRLADAASLGKVVRGHWGIENNLHWSLDVVFREDQARMRRGNAAENFSILRRIALNLFRQDRSVKAGIKNRRLLAASDDAYRLKLMTGQSRCLMRLPWSGRSKMDAKLCWSAESSGDRELRGESSGFSCHTVSSGASLMIAQLHLASYTGAALRVSHGSLDIKLPFPSNGVAAGIITSADLAMELQAFDAVGRCRGRIEIRSRSGQLHIPELLNSNMTELLLGSKQEDGEWFLTEIHVCRN